MKKVSFVIPTHNSSAWLPHAIESAQKQDYDNVEIVVIDDASTDSTRKILNFMAAKDSRIKAIRLEKNVGRSKARNIGNMESSGDYILVLDADDIAYPNRARLTADKLERCDFVNGSAEEIDAIGNIQGVYQAEVFNKDRAIREKMNRIVHSSCGYRREIAQKFKYPDGEPARLGLDDWQFQLEVALSGARMDIITPVIGAYRILNSGVSKTRDPKQVDTYKTEFLKALKVAA